MTLYITWGAIFGLATLTISAIIAIGIIFSILNRCFVFAPRPKWIRYWYLGRYWGQKHLFGRGQVLLLDGMADGMLVLNPYDEIVQVNQAIEEMVQQPASQLIGQPAALFFPDLAAHLPTNHSVSLKRKGPDGSYRSYTVSIRPLQHRHHKPNGRLLMFHDVTQQQEQQALHEDMLRTLVHDLKSPLCNSLFALQMLQQDMSEASLMGESHQLLQMTIDSIERTIQLVGSILDIGRLESNQMPVVLSAVPLHTLIANVLKNQATRIAEKKLQLYCDVSESHPPVWADKRLLERILQNLLDNSIKFTPTGGIIAIEVVEAHDPIRSPKPNYLLVSISDTGIGISPELQERIFEKFTTDTNGYGLGLAFCKSGLAAHGENIWVTSTPGKGTTFVFSLAIAHHARQSPHHMAAHV